MASTSRNISVVSKDTVKSYHGNNEEMCGTASNENLDSIEDIFYKRLVEYDESHSGSYRKPWTQERIHEVIADLKNIRVTMKKKSVDYYWMSKYDVVTTPSEEYLISKKKHPTEPTVRIIPREQYFDLLSEIHTSCGHGGRDKMLHDIKSKFYVPKKAVEIFVSLCPVCESKRGGYKNDSAARIVTLRNANEGGQFDLIDFKSCPDGEFQWLLSYQNLATKFTILRPLKTMSAVEVASELLITFLTLGPPHTLQSDLGHDYTTSILDELSVMWPDCNIIHGTQDDKDQNSNEIKTLLQAWMTENNSTNWAIGCFFVQYYKNTTFHRTLGKLPYEAFFGCLPKAPLNFSPVNANSISENEEQLPFVPETQIHEEEQINSNIKLEIKIENTGSDPLNMENEFEEKFTPPIRENESSNAYKCKSCGSTIHVICGVIEDDQGQKLKVSCYVCKSEQDMELVRNKASKRPAEDVTDNSSKKISTLDIGYSVMVAVPKVHRGALNTKTIKGKIVDFRNGVYRVATNIGTIKNWFSRHDLQKIETDYGDTLETPISLDEAVASQPTSDGHGFQKCNCKPAVNQCHNNRCVCFKNKVLCGPKCHQSLTCVNT